MGTVFYGPLCIYTIVCYLSSVSIRECEYISLDSQYSELLQSFNRQCLVAISLVKPLFRRVKWTVSYSVSLQFVFSQSTS